MYDVRAKQKLKELNYFLFWKEDIVKLNLYINSKIIPLIDQYDASELFTRRMIVNSIYALNLKEGIYDHKKKKQETE